MKEQTLSLFRLPNFQRAAFILASLAGGALAFLALAARLSIFWRLSRWPRIFVLGAGGVLCGLLFGLVLRAAWTRLAHPPRLGKLAWLAAAIALGFGLKTWIGWIPPALPSLYTLEIKTPGSSAQNSGTVLFMELRDSAGQAIHPADLKMQGSWQRNKNGWAAQSDQPASLRYSFYASQKGKLQALFAERPGGGQVLLALNGQNRLVDLDSAGSGEKLVDIPFQTQSRWDTLLLAADLALVGLVFPLFLFVLPYYGIRTTRWAVARGNAALRRLTSVFDYQKLFIIVFIGLCLLPFQNFQGSLATIDSFFGMNNRFWIAYSWIRAQVFRDRILGRTLISPGDWLILTNDNNLEDYQNAIPFTQEQLFQLQQRIDGTARRLKEKGIKFLIVIPPNKDTIYPEHVPPEIPVIGGESRLDQLISYQKAHGETQVLDLRPALMQAREEHQVFYRTDTHWNPYGAYIGYVEVMHALQKDFPILQPNTLDQYRVVPEPDLMGDLAYYWVQGARKEDFFALAPLFPKNITKWDLKLGRLMFTFEYNQSASALPSAVIYHDSFMDELMPFLSGHFSKATYIRTLTYDTGVDETFIEREKPDIVILESNERLMDKALFMLSP